MSDPDLTPQHPTPHSEEETDVSGSDLSEPAVPAEDEPHPGDVDDRPMRAPGGVNTEVDRIFGDDSPR